MAKAKPNLRSPKPIKHHEHACVYLAVTSEIERVDAKKPRKVKAVRGFAVMHPGSSPGRQTVVR
jgi:hypothetical protein